MDKELLAKCNSYEKRIKKKANQFRKMQPKEEVNGYTLISCNNSRSPGYAWEIVMETPYPECMSAETVEHFVKYDLQNGILELFNKDSETRTLQIESVRIQWKNNSPFWSVALRSNLSFFSNGNGKKLDIIYAPERIDDDTLKKDIAELKLGCEMMTICVKDKTIKPWRDAQLLEKKRSKNNPGMWENCIRSNISGNIDPKEARKKLIYEAEKTLDNELKIDGSWLNPLLVDETYQRLYPFKTAEGCWCFRFLSKCELKATRNFTIQYKQSAELR